jgi:hypothetical protein
MAQNEENLGDKVERAGETIAQKALNKITGLINQQVAPIVDEVRDWSHVKIGGQESLIYAKLSNEAFNRLDLGPDRYAIATEYALKSNVAAVNTNVDRGKYIVDKGTELAIIALSEEGKAGKQSLQDLRNYNFRDAIINGFEAISGRRALANVLSMGGGGLSNLGKDAVVGIYNKVKTDKDGMAPPIPGDDKFIGPVEFIGPVKPEKPQKIEAGKKDTNVKVSGGETVSGQPPVQNTPAKPRKPGEQKTH